MVTLESSLGGYHIVELDGETWLLERGAYWASEGTVEIGYHREPLRRAVLAGEGQSTSLLACVVLAKLR